MVIVRPLVKLALLCELGSSVAAHAGGLCDAFLARKVPVTAPVALVRNREFRAKIQALGQERGSTLNTIYQRARSIAQLDLELDHLKGELKFLNGQLHIGGGASAKDLNTVVDKVREVRTRRLNQRLDERRTWLLEHVAETLILTELELSDPYFIELRELRQRYFEAGCRVNACIPRLAEVRRQLDGGEGEPADVEQLRALLNDLRERLEVSIAEVDQLGTSSVPHGFALVETTWERYWDIGFKLLRRLAVDPLHLSEQERVYLKIAQVFLVSIEDELRESHRRLRDHGGEVVYLMGRQF